MTKPNIDDWRGLLTRLNAACLHSARWESFIPPDKRRSAWCGSEPASEQMLLEGEQRLGVTLPPSYRIFLSLSNGWSPFGAFIKTLPPVHEVDWLRYAWPEQLASIQECYEEDVISDRDYLDYETDEHNVAIRHRYYPDCLLVGLPWGAEADMVLLNSKIVFSNGEWEAIVFGNWLPGNQRYRSFGDYCEASVAFVEKSLRKEEGQ